LKAGFNVIVVDNLCNSSAESLRNVEKLSHSKISFYKIDIRDKAALIDVFKKNSIDAVIHFAAFKSINESIEKPLLYYDNNVVGVLKLLEALQEKKIYNFIFSSSAAVYGNPSKSPVTEENLRSVTNPYAATKLIAENILLDLAKADDLWKISILRYFNPIGAHSSGLIGEIPDKIPNNLMPYINLVASGHFPYLNVFGGDYNTKDGTAIRDYLHVSDLAESHVAALKGLNFQNGADAFNIGTGKGISVLELINAFEESNKVKVPYKIIERRIGDSESVFADPSKAIKALKWKAKKNLLQMCEDSWRWQKRR
jgi:UDP-glucose 4-epimerase